MSEDYDFGLVRAAIIIMKHNLLTHIAGMFIMVYSIFPTTHPHDTGTHRFAGNGVQKAFYDDPNVLYVSIHVHQDGKFYPGGPEGDWDHCGEGAGEGR